MSTGICSCTAPTFGSMNRPNCVIEMKNMAYPIIVPRYKADGVTRNSIDASSLTIGADVIAMLSATLDSQERMYPFPRVEEPTWERTATVFETPPSGRKYKIDGQGGIYNVAFKTYAKDAVAALLKEAQKFGCSDFDFYVVDIAGNLWGELEGTNLYGYQASAETFDAFWEFATDTTVQKMNVSWDLDSDVTLANSFALTPEDLGYKATSLEGNISATQEGSALTSTTLQSIVSTGFGSAASPDYVEGLLTAAFTVYNNTTASAVVVTANEATAGHYVLTMTAQTATDDLLVTVAATGYDVSSVNIAAL